MMLLGSMWKSPVAVAALMAGFAAVALLVYSILQFLSKGLQSYEEKYVGSATRSLDAMYLTMSAQQILYISLLCTLVVFILIAVTTANLVLGLALGLLAFVGPGVTIRMLKCRRDRKFNEQLVDSLMAMGNALRVGHSLPASLELIAKEMDNPMGQEMSLVVQEMRLGVAMEDALGHLHERMPGEDLDILITSIMISREVGGNLAEIFDTIADTIRDRHRLQGKISSLTAQGKLQGAIIGLLPVMIALFLHASNPELLRPMYTDWVGIAMLGAIVVMEAIGVLMIWKIVSIKI